MDELIVILIKAIIEIFGSGSAKRQPQARPPAMSLQQLLATQRIGAPAPPVLRPPPVVLPLPPSIVQKIATRPVVRKAPGPISDSLRPGDLSDPSTLRRRFILSEILRPPVALRPAGNGMYT